MVLPGRQFGGGRPAAVRAVLRRGATRAGLTSPEGKQDPKVGGGSRVRIPPVGSQNPPPPRKAAVPLVNSLSLEAGLLAHCSENSLNCLPSKGKSSTEPPSGFPERCLAGLPPAVLEQSLSLRAVLAPSPQGTLPPRRAQDRGGPRASLCVSVPGALGSGELTTQPSARVRAGPRPSALASCLSWVLPACVCRAVSPVITHSQVSAASLRDTAGSHREEGRFPQKAPELKS